MQLHFIIAIKLFAIMRRGPQALRHYLVIRHGFSFRPIKYKANYSIEGYKYFKTYNTYE